MGGADDVVGQSPGFGPQQDRVVFFVFERVVVFYTFGRYGEQPIGPDCVQEPIKITMHLDVRPLSVVQSRSSKTAIIERETQRFDQMQAKAGVCGHSNDVAGVGGYLGFIQDDVKHVAVG